MQDLTLGVECSDDSKLYFKIFLHMWNQFQAGKPHQQAFKKVDIMLLNHSTENLIRTQL